MQIYQKILKLLAGAAVPGSQRGITDPPPGFFWLVMFNDQKIHQLIKVCARMHGGRGHGDGRGHAALGRDNVTFKLHYFSKWENNHKWAQHQICASDSELWKWSNYFQFKYKKSNRWSVHILSNQPTSAGVCFLFFSHWKTLKFSPGFNPTWLDWSRQVGTSEGGGVGDVGTGGGQKAQEVVESQWRSRETGRERQEVEQEVQYRAVRERATDEDGSTVRGTCSRLERLLPPALINFTTETDCDDSPPKQETHCVLHPNNPCTPAWPARRADHKSRPGCTKIISFPHLISWTPFFFQGEIWTAAHTNSADHCLSQHI